MTRIRSQRLSRQLKLQPQTLKRRQRGRQREQLQPRAPRRPGGDLPQVPLPPLVEARLRQRQVAARRQRLVGRGQIPAQAAPALLEHLPAEVIVWGAESNPEASTPSVPLTGMSFPGERTAGPATFMWRAVEWTFIMDWPGGGAYPLSERIIRGSSPSAGAASSIIRTRFGATNMLIAPTL